MDARPADAQGRSGKHAVALRSAGLEVWASAHFGAGHESGFPAYPNFRTEQMLDGTYATYIAQFDGQLAVYNIANGTIRRRVAGGLSTRFAFGLGSPSPLVVQPESEFATAFLKTNRVGTVLTDPDHLLVDLRANQSDYRRAWQECHAGWSAEGQAGRIQAFLRQAGRR